MARLPANLDDTDRQRSFSYYYTPKVREHIISRLIPENTDLMMRFMPERGEAERAF